MSTTPGSSPRKLVWSEKAKEDVKELLNRRHNKAAVLDCIEGQLLAVATSPGITVQAPGPLRERIFRFTCQDGNVTLYLTAAFTYSTNHEIGVVVVQSQAF